MLEETTVTESNISEVKSIKDRIELVKADFKRMCSYQLNETTLKDVIADGWNAGSIPEGRLGIYGFIANKGNIGLLFGYSKGYMNDPDAVIAKAVEDLFQQRINDYINDLTPNAEWVYNYNRVNDSNALVRVCDLVFEQGVLIEKNYLI